MTSKQRAYLKGLAMKMEPIMQLGKGSVTPENTAAVDDKQTKSLFKKPGDDNGPYFPDWKSISYSRSN